MYLKDRGAVFTGDFLDCFFYCLADLSIYFLHLFILITRQTDDRSLLGFSKLLIKKIWKRKVPFLSVLSFSFKICTFPVCSCSLWWWLFPESLLVFFWISCDVYLCELVHWLQLQVVVSLMADPHSFRPGIWQWRRYCPSPQSELGTGLKRSCDFWVVWIIL